MKKRMNRVLAMLLALVLVVGMVPGFALEAHAVTSKEKKDGFSVTVEKAQYCKYCLVSAHYANLVLISNVQTGSGSATITFQVRYGLGGGNCGKASHVGPYVGNDDSSTVFTYTVSGGFYCDQDFSLSLKDIDFGNGNDKPTKLVGSVTRTKTSHTVSTWYGYTNNQHIGACSKCGKTVTESCSGDGSATCSVQGTCTTCGGSYYNSSVHNYLYTANGNTLTQTCSDCRLSAVTATLKATNQTYTGSPITTGASITYGTGWAGETPQPAAGDYSDNTNAGTATVKTTVEGKELTTTFTITPYNINSGKVTVAFAPVSGTYNGQAQTPAVTVTFDGNALTEGTDYEAVWSGDLTNAGTYTLTLNGRGNFSGTRYADYTIDKAQPAVTAPRAKELTYTGAAQELVEAGSTPAGVMHYSTSENGTYSDKIPVGTDAGEYTVWYKAVVPEDNTNYTSSTPASVNVTIGEAEPTYTAPTPKTGLVYQAEALALIDAGQSEHGTFQYSLTGDDDDWSGEIPTADAAGDYTVYWKLVGDRNHQNAEGNVSVTIDRAQLIPSIDASIDGTVTKVYDGTTAVPGDNLRIKLEGLYGTDAVTAAGTFAYASADAGTTTVNATGITLSGEQAGNYKLTTDVVSAEVGQITAKSIEGAEIEGLSLTWNGTGQTADPEGLVVDGLDVTYALSGNTATNVGAYKMTLTATGNFQGEVEVEFSILPDEAILEGITTANVTSNHQETINKAKAMAANADTSGFPEEQKEALDAILKEIGDQAAALEEVLKEAWNAASTEKVEKGVAITADNAKASDKQTLTDAKADLEAALSNHGTNYTTEEQKILNDEIDRIEGILADIAKAEETIKAIEALPETVSPDDTKNKAKIDEAQAAYDALTAGQKQIVDNSTGKKLETLQAELLDIDKIKGSGSWIKGSGKDLEFVFNGPYESFDHLEIDGKEVNAKNYTVSKGSTVITLKNAYLETLSYGKHKLVAVYKIDGQQVRSDADGEVVEVNVRKAASNASTGDQSNVGLWAGIGGVSIVALIVLLVVMKKGKK